MPVECLHYEINMSSINDVSIPLLKEAAMWSRFKIPGISPFKIFSFCTQKGVPMWQKTHRKLWCFHKDNTRKMWTCWNKCSKGPQTGRAWRYLSSEESWDSAAWGREGSGGAFKCVCTWWEWVKKTELGSSQWCAIIGQEAKWNTKYLIWREERRDLW